MINDQSLLIDVISILPEQVDLFIQAPSLDDEVILSLMTTTEYDYYKSIKINDATKKIFIDRISNYPIEEYFQNIQIRFDNKLLFEGHDGVEFGIISNSLNLPVWFVDKHVKTGTCNISKEW